MNPLACALGGCIAAAPGNVIPYVAEKAVLPAAYATAPVVAAAAPAPVLPAALAAPSSQFQAQDEFGNVQYGYSNINSNKHEVGNAYGGVAGSYSYVDAHGIPQTVNYVADALGYRVQASNLPVAPAVPAVAPLEAPVFTGVAPVQVEDTPEVKEAKAKFQARFDEEAARTKRSVALPYAGLYGNAYGLGLNPYSYGYNLPLNYASGYSALPYATAYATPAVAPAVAPAATVVSAPAAREAVLTKIKLNPGFAEAYRVD